MNKETDFKKLLTKYSNLSKFKKGDRLFNYQQKADKIYFILNGLIRVYIKNNNEEIEIKRVKKGQFLGETALTAVNYSSRAEAYLKTNVLTFKAEDFKKIIRENNEFAFKLINNLTTHIEKLENLAEISLPPISEIDKKIAAEKEIKKSLAAKKQKEKAVKKAVKNIKNDFYLKGHKNYEQKAEQDFDYYLYDKEIECPICSHNFEVKKIRNSRLRISEIREDLRPIYKNFKLYYYNIWSCPKCYFTSRINDFDSFSKHKRKKIHKNFKQIVQKDLGKEFKIDFKNPRKIDNVFNAYYLAVKLYDYVDLADDKKTFLWREISWIYEDLKEPQLANKASLKALEHLKEFYFKDHSHRSKKKNDNLSLLLAVLFYKHGKSDKALPLLDDLIRDKKTNLRQKNKARDLFLKIREENKA